MGIVSILMTGVGLSMDAFAVALAKGMNLKKDLLKNALKIGAFFGIFQGLMPLIGWFFGIYFKSYIEAFDHWIAFILLGIIGGKMIYESFKGDEEEVEENVDISNKNLLLLAIATSIDALAVGVTFAFLNVNIVESIIIIGVTTFILSVVAVFLGKKLGSLFQKYAEVIGGIILIGIGVKILLEHLFM